MKPILGKGGDFLKLLLQFGIVFGIYWVSQWIESVLPFPFPASVISLLLLLALLLLRVIKVEKVQDMAGFLLGNLAFFFVPVVSGMMNYVDVLKGRLLPIVVICLVSTAVTMGATAWAVQITCRLMAKRKGEKK